MRGLSTKARLGWVPALVLLVQLLRLAVLLRRPNGRLANEPWDDVFYYLELARNFAAHGRWTFDGVEPASGFHLLWGYGLAAVYWLDPGIGLHGIVLVTGLVQMGCVAGAAALMVRTAVRLWGPGAELGVAVVFLSALSLVMGSSMMETAPVMLLSAAVLDLLCRDEPAAGWGWAFALGLLGMLARSDFGLMPAVMLGAVLVLWGMRRGSVKQVRVAAAVLAGSAAGLGVVLLHTRWVAGEWVQSSARQKLFWSEVVGYSTRPARMLLLCYGDASYYQGPGNWAPALQRMAHREPRVLAVLGLGALGAAWVQQKQARRRVLLVGLVAVVGLYVWFYRYNSDALQDWYIANFEAPLALVAGAAAAWVFGRMRRTAWVLTGLVCLCGIAGSFRPDDGADAPLYTAGIYLRAHPELRPVGAFNAGAIGYFSGGGVVNLDGLVNDRIYPYARSGMLLDYVHRRGLRTILDADLTVDPAVMAAAHASFMAQTGGYADGRLWHCLVADPPLPDALGRGATVFHVRPGCGFGRTGR